MRHLQKSAIAALASLLWSANAFAADAYSSLNWQTYTWQQGDATIVMTGPTTPTGSNFARFCFMTSVEGAITSPQYYLGVKNPPMYVEPSLTNWSLDQSKFYVGTSYVGSNYVGILPGQVIRLPGGGQPYVGITPGTTGAFYLGVSQVGSYTGFNATVYATPPSYASPYTGPDWRLYGTGATTRAQAVCVSFPTP